MGLGAAIGGLAGGYAKGVQIRSDLEDAKENRGLKALQRQQAELELDRNKQLTQVRGQMSEAIRGFQGADLNDTEAWNAQANTLEGLLVQEAGLTGASTYDALKNFRELTNNRFSEQVFAAAQFINRGDPAGIDMLKPVKNRFMPDGNMLTGGTYNKNDDTWDLSYQDKDGNTRMVSMPREELARSLPLYMNIGDASKLMMQQQLKEDERAYQDKRDATKMEFEGVQTDKTLDAKILSAKITAAATTDAAQSRGVTRRNERLEDRINAGVIAIEKGIADHLGYNPKMAIAADTQRYNNATALALQIYETNAIASKGASLLRSSELVRIMQSIEEGTAKINDVPNRKDLKSVVLEEGIRAIIPAALIKPAQ